MDYLRKQSSERAGQMVGAVNTDFDLNRQALLAGLGRKRRRWSIPTTRRRSRCNWPSRFKALWCRRRRCRWARGLGAVLVEDPN